MNLSWTDIIVITILAILVGNGTYQGFLRSLVAPICFIATSALGYAVYLISNQPTVGLFIALFGPILLTWGLNSLIRAKLGDKPKALTLTSQLCGAAINLLWGGTILFFSMLLITLLPFDQSGLNAVKKDMNSSFAYPLLEKIIAGKKLDAKEDGAENCPTGSCSISEADAEALQADQDIQNLINDPRIQKIINDPTLHEAAKNKDIATLLKNPALRELCQDPALIAKLFKIIPKLKELMNDAP